MDDEDDVVAEVEAVPQRKEILALFGIGVAVRPRGREFLGIAHADQVAGDQPALSLQMRHDITPEIGGGRVAVLEDDRIALPLVDIGHAFAVDGGELLFGIGFGGHWLPSLSGP